ncbi:MAG: NAD(P)/FAD-dependent oxidoreductase [Hyphomicrobiaceae bacterium]
MTLVQNDPGSCSPRDSGPTPLAGKIRPATASYWQDQYDNQKRFSGSERTIPGDVDIAIVGGGLAGLTTAIKILERKPSRRVVVLEAHFVGYGASGRNGGLMSPTPAPIWFASARHNEEHSWAMGHFNKKVHDAAGWLAQQVPTSEIKHAPVSIKASGNLTRAIVNEMAGTLSHCDIEHIVNFDPINHRPVSVDMPGYTVQPFGLVQGLAQRAQELGAEIFQHVSAQKIWRDGSKTNVSLKSGDVVRTQKVIVCTNAYTKELNLGATKVRAKPVHNYMLATRQIPAQDLGDHTQPDLFTVELNKAYVFYRSHSNRIIFGGIEKLSQQTNDDFEVPDDVLKDLRQHFSNSFPSLKSVKISQAWGGKFHQTLTDLPIIQTTKENSNLILNVGYGGTGVALTLTCASLAAALALDGHYENDHDQRLHDAITKTRLPITGALRAGGRIAMDLIRPPKSHVSS